MLNRMASYSLKVGKHLICTRPIWMLFVKVISVQLAASERYKQNFIWAKTFIDSSLAGELPRIFFGCERLHFVLIETVKAVVTSEFTQSFSWMKFRSKCPDLCLVDSALLARVQRLVHMSSVVHAFRRLLVSVSAHTVKRTKPPYHGIACLLSSSSSSKNFHAPIFLRHWIEHSRFCTAVRKQILTLAHTPPAARAACG